MPKVKVNRKSVSMDMTAMTDVAFLLLTFFILTTTFKPDESVIVDTPTSISEKHLESKEVIVVSVDKDNKVYFSVDGASLRKDLLTKMGEKYGLTFTDKEKQEFANMSDVCVPINELSAIMKMGPFERKNYPTKGVPVDSLNNQLADWISSAREINNYLKLGLKGDKDAKYTTTKKVISTIVEKYDNQFYFVTGLEADPRKAPKE